MTCPPVTWRRPALLTLLALTTVSLALPVLAAKKKHRAPVQSDDSADVVTYGQRDDVQAYGRALAASANLDPAWVGEQLAQARFQPSITRLVMPPAAGTAKNWAAYRARFVDARRVQDGLRWWQVNDAALQRAEARFGVPAAMIVAIVGVETFYGRIRGHYKTLDALATLSFDFPSGRSDRSAFYRDELAAFLRWCAAEKRDPQSVKGSYAGAMGLPQFMPSSILKYAIDFDGDGHIDLDDSGADVVGSVANYFAQFGWQRGLPTHFSVAAPVDVRDRATLLAPDILPSFTAQQMADKGAVLDERGRAHTGPLALVELQNGDSAPSYVAGTQNFYVVTRYNWSSYYALAVIDLARQLDAMRPSDAAPAASAP
jgi:membrane-bound lytic murein transglycosylase B